MPILSAHRIGGVSNDTLTSLGASTLEWVLFLYPIISQEDVKCNERIEANIGLNDLLPRQQSKKMI